MTHVTSPAPPTVRSCHELLRGMVGINSVNDALADRKDSELALALYLESVARTFGFASSRMPVRGNVFNLFVMHEVRPAAPWLLFVSHMDTVGVEGMTIDPFAGEIRDGRLHGRGACDTKGSGAAMLWALKEYAASRETGNNVAVVFTVDEEIGKAGIHALCPPGSSPSWGMVGGRAPAGAIVGEPTRLRMVAAHCGCVRWTIRTRGVAAHSSNPSRGRSAISAMVKVIQAIESRYIPSLTASHPLTGRAVCSVNQIHGGVSVNVIPESCEIRLDRRIVPGEDMHAVLPGVERLLDELRMADPTLDVVQEEPFLDPALDPAGSERFIDTVGGVLRGLGLDAAPMGVPFSTEAANLSHAGVPTVVLGPGDIAAAHTKDESVELTQLDGAVKVYGAIMRRAI